MYRSRFLSVFPTLPLRAYPPSGLSGGDGRPTVGLEENGDDPVPFDPHYLVGSWRIEGSLADSALGAGGEFSGSETVVPSIRACLRGPVRVWLVVRLRQGYGGQPSRGLPTEAHVSTGKQASEGLRLRSTFAASPLRWTAFSGLPAVACAEATQASEGW